MRDNKEGKLSSKCGFVDFASGGNQNSTAEIIKKKYLESYFLGTGGDEP